MHRLRSHLLTSTWDRTTGDTVSKVPTSSLTSWHARYKYYFFLELVTQGDSCPYGEGGGNETPCCYGSPVSWYKAELCVERG